MQRRDYAGITVLDFKEVTADVCFQGKNMTRLEKSLNARQVTGGINIKQLNYCVNISLLHYKLYKTILKNVLIFCYAFVHWYVLHNFMSGYTDIYIYTCRYI